VDSDAPTVAWARRRAECILGARAADLQFVEADVMASAPPAVAPADILSVMNFSILYLREPTQLQAYLNLETAVDRLPPLDKPRGCWNA